MKLMPLTGTAARWAAGLLVAAGLALGIGIQPVAADDEDEIPPPTPLTLRIEGTEAHITFRDNSENEEAFSVYLEERDHPGVTVFRAQGPGVPGAGRVVSRSVQDIKPGVAYCARVAALRFDTHVVPGLGVDLSNSAALCAAPTDLAVGPDLAIANIRGREEVEGGTGRTLAYLVEFRNDGADADGTVVVDIATSGVLTLADQTAVRAGWEADGFTCAATAPSGGANAGLRCSGGSLKQGQSTNPAVMVRVIGPGFGHIHASIGVGSGPADPDTRDNGLALGVRVY